MRAIAIERGIDPAFTETGAEIASRMILELCGGEASTLVIAGKVPDTARSYLLRKDRVKSLGGIDVPLAEQKRILTALGFGVTETSAGLQCAVPSWRPDVHGEADLVEDVCRIVGLDTVPLAAMERPSAVAKPVLNVQQKRMVAARRMLAARGLNEAVTWSFLPEEQAKLFGGGQPELKLANPISSELSDMRPSLLPNLIAAAGRNMARGFADLGLFEVGQAYAGDRMKDETLRAAGIRRGLAVPRNWQGQSRACRCLRRQGRCAGRARCGRCGGRQPPDRGRGAGLVSSRPLRHHPDGPAEQARDIRRNPSARAGRHGCEGPAGWLRSRAVGNSGAEGEESATRAALNVSDLMSVSRDFAFVVDDGIEADKLVKAAKGADKVLIGDVTVFDVFAGGSLGEGKKSLAIEVTLNPREKTLTDEEIEAVSARIVAQVQKATGGVLRR